VRSICWTYSQGSRRAKRPVLPLGQTKTIGQERKTNGRANSTAPATLASNYCRETFHR
jgi:hypothetical protein